MSFYSLCVFGGFAKDAAYLFDELGRQLSHLLDVDLLRPCMHWCLDLSLYILLAVDPL